MITTDTIPLRRSSDKITVLSTDKLFAKVIDGVISSNSISSLFDYDHFMDLNDIT